MNKKATYELFIGLLALMISIMLILEVTLVLPREVKYSFYYTDIIIWAIFVIDYFVRLIISKNKVKFISDNIIDLFSIIPFKVYLVVLKLIYLQISILATIQIVSLIRIVILLLKFKRKIRESIKINSFNYILILTTIVIVMSSIIISLLENMSFGDALWWCFVTFTTVGYGDVVLNTITGRIMAAILMVIGIGFIGITTSTIAMHIINGGNIKARRNFKDELIENIKYKLDSYDELSEKDIDDIYKTLKSLKK